MICASQMLDHWQIGCGLHLHVSIVMLSMRTMTMISHCSRKEIDDNDEDDNIY